MFGLLLEKCVRLGIKSQWRTPIQHVFWSCISSWEQINIIFKIPIVFVMIHIHVFIVTDLPSLLITNFDWLDRSCRIHLEGSGDTTVPGNISG